MNQALMTAWLFSVVLGIGVFVIGRRCGLGRLLSFALAAALMPTPIVVVVRGGGSAVYAFDLCVLPLLLGALRVWRRVPHPTHVFVSCSILGLGVIPLVTSYLFGTQGDASFNALSLWRLMGAGAFCCLGSTQRRRICASERLLDVLSWACIVIAAALLLQIFGVVDANPMRTRLSLFGSDTSEHCFVLGLFRGTEGIFGMLACIALLSGVSRRTAGALRIAGGVAGTLLIIVVGSKTSLVATILCAMAWGFVTGRSWRRGLLKPVLVASVAFVGIVATGSLLDSTSRWIQMTAARTIGTLRLENDSLATLEIRERTWDGCLESLSRDPMGWIGVRTSTRVVYLAAYHSDYVAALASGGVISVALLVTALVAVSLGLRRSALQGNEVTLAAILCLIGNVVQGATVSHLIPGTLFVQTVAVSLFFYGVGTAEVGAATRR